MLIHLNDIDLFYEVTGHGQPFILVHGNGEDHTIFDVLTQQLAPNYTVYAVDSRGHGQSSAVPYLRYRDMAEDMAALIARLGLVKPLYYGFSDGGIVGLILASRYPGLLDRLIISGANTVPQGVKPLATAGLQLYNLFRPDQRREMMLTQPHIKKSELARIDVPTLVLAGEHDVIQEEHTRALAAAIPGSQLLILPGQTHGSYVIHSDLLYPVIQTFLGQ